LTKGFTALLEQTSKQVRQIAIHNIVSFTPSNSEFFPIFLKHAKALCKDLKAMVKEDPVWR
jgi:hypothetical protein